MGPLSAHTEQQQQLLLQPALAATIPHVFLMGSAKLSIVPALHRKGHLSRRPQSPASRPETRALHASHDQWKQGAVPQGAHCTAFWGGGAGGARERVPSFQRAERGSRAEDGPPQTKRVPRSSGMACNPPGWGERQTPGKLWVGLNAAPLPRQGGRKFEERVSPRPRTVHTPRAPPGNTTAH